MAKNYFIPRADADKQLWLQNFAAKLPTYAVKYEILAADVTDTQKGSAYFSYWLNYQNQFNEFAKKVTQFKTELRDGITSGGAGVPPSAPVFGAAPAAVDPGVFKRVTSIASVIKSKMVYTEADGKDMGIEGTEAAAPDMNAAKPMIQVHLVAGGHPEIVWKKAGMDGIDIYVDRGAGQFQFLAVDSFPNYTDTAPLPAVGASAIWKYRCIYRFDDAQAGEWSDVTSITVAGTV